jgi:hypothetical protein
MNERQEAIEVTLIEKIGVGSSSWDRLKAPQETDISQLVKEMKLYSLSQCEFNWSRDTYLPSSGPLSEGPLQNGATYRVYREDNSKNSIYSLCRKFEKKHTKRSKVLLRSI